MRSLATVFLLVVLTFLCWGVYGPILHEGQHAMRDTSSASSLRPLICVGVAYFLIAVVVPVALLLTKGEKGRWSIGGFVWSFLAGAAGAVGVLGIILAFKCHGGPIYVMPLVFGLAPVVNTLMTMAMTRTYRKAGMILFVALIVVAVGVAGVLLFRPRAENVDVSVSENDTITITLRAGVETRTTTVSLETLQTDPDYDDYYRWYLRKEHPTLGELCKILGSIILTALCWGLYGPMLHKGQTKMAGSRLRPFLCVGLAYYLVAVVVPWLILLGATEPGHWTVSGCIWSLLAGAVGALAALGIVLAFNAGGKPIYVMPFVFGGAPVVNSLVSIAHEKTYNLVSVPFCVSLLIVIGGAVAVLIVAPRPDREEDKMTESV